MRKLGKFVAQIRERLTARRIRREIYSKIFPHLRGEAGHGYAFHSDEEIVDSNMRAFLATESMLRLIERAASKMPKSEGDAFRHIAYRDLQKRMWTYVEFAHERMHPSDRELGIVEPCTAA